MGYALLMQKGIGVDSSDLSASPGDVLTGGNSTGQGLIKYRKGPYWNKVHHPMYLA